MSLTPSRTHTADASIVECVCAAEIELCGAIEAFVIFHIYTPQ